LKRGRVSNVVVPCDFKGGKQVQWPGASPNDLAFKCVRNEMLKYGQALLPSIGKLFNLILQSGTYPSVWSTRYVIPIHKSGDITDPNNQ